jgi:hypothetical protein
MVLPLGHILRIRTDRFGVAGLGSLTFYWWGTHELFTLLVLLPLGSVSIQSLFLGTCLWSLLLGTTFWRKTGRIVVLLLMNGDVEVFHAGVQRICSHGDGDWLPYTQRLSLLHRHNIYFFTLCPREMKKHIHERNTSINPTADSFALE